MLESIARDHFTMASGTNDPRMSSAIGLAGLADTTRRAAIRFHGKQNRELTLRLSAMRHIDYCYTADFRDAKALLDELSV